MSDGDGGKLSKSFIDSTAKEVDSWPAWMKGEKEPSKVSASSDIQTRCDIPACNCGGEMGLHHKHTDQCKIDHWGDYGKFPAADDFTVYTRANPGLIKKNYRAHQTSGRGASKQDYETPPEFMNAVHDLIGVPIIDLAANEKNFKAPLYISCKSLEQDWSAMASGGLGWLNPPFEYIAPWARKCNYESVNMSIAFLTLASMGAKWMRKWVMGTADIYILSTRITFVGCPDPYPKDCSLSYFGPMSQGKIYVWDWVNRKVLKQWNKA